MIIGHQQAQEYFFTRNQLRHHAYLFHGAEGVGKSHFAWQLLAKWFSVSAESLKSGAGHPDFRYLKAAEIGKRITVDDVRQAVSELMLTAIGDKRALLIDCADDLGMEAANALLKFLEEPPANSYLILVSHAPDKLPVTIRSRLLPIVFNPLTDEETKQILSASGVDTAQATSLLPLTQGKPGLFLRLYQQECHLFIDELEQALQNLPDINKQQLDRLTKDLSYEQFYCLTHHISRFFVAVLVQNNRDYQKFYAVPHLHIMQLWHKIHHYLRNASLPAGMGFNASQIAYFILHSLYFLSKKHA
ncbi:MAG: AAA family ATPase [Alphaproteobacteria bacterium]|nr:AAA family ATPase [Alphaproteobacteria bacterium]